MVVRSIRSVFDEGWARYKGDKGGERLEGVGGSAGLEGGGAPAESVARCRPVSPAG